MSDPAPVPASGPGPDRRRYLGLALVALATLALEIALTRLVSFASWYHLAFFAISVCMLGMTAGAIRVHLRPRPEPSALVRDCLLFAAAAAITVVTLCWLPMTRYRANSVMPPLMLVATLVCTAPFYFAGAVVAQVLSTPGLPTGRLYAADLAGAAVGCLVVLGALEVLDVPSLILLCAAAGAAAGLLFCPGDRRPVVVAVGMAALALWNGTREVPLLAPRHTKGRQMTPASQLLISRWNSFSHVAVRKEELTPAFYWGPSPFAPHPKIPTLWMEIDGAAGTPAHPMKRPEDLGHLRYDVTNIAHYLRRTGPAAVIGVGGGRDVQSALLFGHERVTAVEVNPIIVAAHRGLLRDYAGIGAHPAVSLHADDGRSFFSRSRDAFSVLQMSLVDTWAATGAGAYSLSENGLYTVEAWKTFVARLAPGGLFTVARWHDPRNLGETGRVVAVAMKTLFDLGTDDPARRLAMVTSKNISTLILARDPLGEADLAVLRKKCEELGFTIAFSPGQPPSHPLLAHLLRARSAPELLALASAPELPFNTAPSTDDCPFFFNMLKPGAIFGKMPHTTGMVTGNLHAEATLIGLILASLVVALGTTLVPLWVMRRRRAGLGAGRVRPPGFLALAVLFSAIGLGFMGVEIGLMQRLSAFLGHPTYALAVLLFSIILSTGAGSVLSDSLAPKRTALLAVVLVGMIAVLPTLLALITTGMEAAPMASRIGVSVALLLPFGLLMGLFFPTGIRLARALQHDEVAWFWALNGVFGTLASGVAVYVSIHFGISRTLHVAALCYAVAAAALFRLVRSSSPGGPAHGGIR